MMFKLALNKLFEDNVFKGCNSKLRRQRGLRSRERQWIDETQRQIEDRNGQKTSFGE